MFGTPKVFVAVLVLACFGMFLGAAHLRYMATMRSITAAAESKGTATADAKNSKAALDAALKTANAERDAEAETPQNPDRTALIAICKRSASCRERRALK